MASTLPGGEETLQPEAKPCPDTLAVENGSTEQVVEPCGPHVQVETVGDDHDDGKGDELAKGDDPVDLQDAVKGDDPVVLQDAVGDLSKAVAECPSDVVPLDASMEQEETCPKNIPLTQEQDVSVLDMEAV